MNVYEFNYDYLGWGGGIAVVSAESIEDALALLGGDNNTLLRGDHWVYSKTLNLSCNEAKVHSSYVYTE